MGANALARDGSGRRGRCWTVRAANSSGLLHSRQPSHRGVPMRIGLAVVLTLSLLAPLASAAQQQSGKLSRIGVLMNLYPPDASPPQALRQRLRDLGYVEGENLVIDWRYQLGVINRLPAVPAER